MTTGDGSDLETQTAQHNQPLITGHSTKPAQTWG